MILTNKNELLQPCQEVSIFEAQEIFNKLEYELNNSPQQGIGLAAPQIGIFKKALIIRSDHSLNLANPIITEQYDLREFNREGCLSFPNQIITTKRYAQIVVKDMFHPNGIVLTGLTAVVAEHEINHLEQKTMFDYQIKRPAKNDPCWCGSGKKYKSCHIGKIIK